ncbi:hypothetical protein XELAEV_18006499mg, partial [Xenopus laevis]
CGSLSETYKPPNGRLTKDVLLGEGGTGDIYKARHHRKGVVAMKIANISRDEESVCREVNFLRKFSGHKNDAAFHGAYYSAPLNECSSELLEIVLEYCGGGSLYDLINSTEGQSLRETWIGYVCKEVLKALKHIHKNRAMHQDIKSPNIMLTEKGKVKLIDFGLCWDLDPQTGKCYESEGTAHWMAPEAIRRRGKPVAYDTKICCTYNTWSQNFVSFLKCCLEPSKSWSAEELLQHPFITELSPKKTIRAKIKKHLQVLQNHLTRKAPVPMTAPPEPSPFKPPQLNQSCLEHPLTASSPSSRAPYLHILFRPPYLHQWYLEILQLHQQSHFEGPRHHQWYLTFHLMVAPPAFSLPSSAPLPPDCQSFHRSTCHTSRFFKNHSSTCDA